MELNKEVRIVGDSKGVLWRIILDKHKGVGKVERISSLKEDCSELNQINGSEHSLSPDANLHDHMQDLTNVIESRFKAA